MDQEARRASCCSEFRASRSERCSCLTKSSSLSTSALCLVIEFLFSHASAGSSGAFISASLLSCLGLLSCLSVLLGLPGPEMGFFPVKLQEGVAIWALASAVYIVWIFRNVTLSLAKCSKVPLGGRLGSFWEESGEDPGPGPGHSSVV